MDFYIHGSADSLDVDVHLIVPEPLSKIEAKALCDNSPHGNANAICIKDGIVVWSYKGSIDETNNGILATYDLHEQHVPLMITRKVERNVGIKVARTIRGMLGMYTRSERRLEIKAALRNDSILEKIKVLRSFTPSSLDIGTRDQIESFKFLAFQIGQCLELIYGDELYTKSDVAGAFGGLYKYLYRRADANPHDLSFYWDELLNVISDIIYEFEVPGLFMCQSKFLIDVQKESAVEWSIS